MERKDLCDRFAFKANYQKVCFSAKAHSRTCSCIRNCISGFYLKIEFLFFRVSIVGILLSMEFEWASLG